MIDQLLAQNRQRRGSLSITGKNTILILLATLALVLSMGFLTGCALLDQLAQPEPVDSNPVQAFLDEHYEALEEAAQEHVMILGSDSTVRFEAGDRELFHTYTFGPGPTVDELGEFTLAFLELPDNRDMYESLAGRLANFMEIDALAITIAYYDNEGNYIASESFHSR